jgi:ElaB/YqjD/DUF883 family membrane-anchored ribosome-binding protein
MHNSPVNRLERHWRKPIPPETQRYIGESSPRIRETTWETNVENFIADHPKLTLVAAAAVGMVLGWMVKRK